MNTQEKKLIIGFVTILVVATVVLFNIEPNALQSLGR